MITKKQQKNAKSHFMNSNVVVIRSLLIQPFYIPSSMEPTLLLAIDL